MNINEDIKEEEKEEDSGFIVERIQIEEEEKKIEFKEENPKTDEYAEPKYNKASLEEEKVPEQIQPRQNRNERKRGQRVMNRA